MTGEVFSCELRFTARHKPVPRGNVSRLASDARRLALHCQGTHPCISRHPNPLIINAKFSGNARWRDRTFAETKVFGHVSCSRLVRAGQGRERSQTLIETIVVSETVGIPLVRSGVTGLELNCTLKVVFGSDEIEIVMDLRPSVSICWLEPMSMVTTISLTIARRELPATADLAPIMRGSICAWLDDSSSVSVPTCSSRQKGSTSPTGRTIPRSTMLSVRISDRHSMCTGRQLFRRASRSATQQALSKREIQLGVRLFLNCRANELSFATQAGARCRENEDRYASGQIAAIP